MQVQEFDALSLIETPGTLRASSAQVAGTIEKYSKLSHWNIQAMLPSFDLSVARASLVTSPSYLVLEPGDGQKKTEAPDREPLKQK
jgi:hypothetical protein